MEITLRSQAHEFGIQADLSLRFLTLSVAVLREGLAPSSCGKHYFTEKWRVLSSKRPPNDREIGRKKRRGSRINEYAEERGFNHERVEGKMGESRSTWPWERKGGRGLISGALEKARIRQPKREYRCIKGSIPAKRNR